MFQYCPLLYLLNYGPSAMIYYGLRWYLGQCNENVHLTFVCKLLSRARQTLIDSGCVMLLELWNRGLLLSRALLVVWYETKLQLPYYTGYRPTCMYSVFCCCEPSWFGMKLQIQGDKHDYFFCSWDIQYTECPLCDAVEPTTGQGEFCWLLPSILACPTTL